MGDQHENGSMDIGEHEKMFSKFMQWTMRSSIAIIAVLIIMAIFFR